MEADEKICPRCAETIKAAAVVCRHCNHEFGASTEAPPAPITAAIPPAVQRPKRNPFAVGCAALFVITAILGFIGYLSQSGQQSSVPGAQDAPAPVVTLAVTALELAQAYTANEVSAQKQYGEKTLDVTGIVTGIRLDMFNNPVIDIAGTNEFLPVQASFDKSFADRLTSISKGQRVTVRCTSITSVLTTPMLSECVFP